VERMSEPWPRHSEQSDGRGAGAIALLDSLVSKPSKWKLVKQCKVEPDARKDAPSFPYYTIRLALRAGSLSGRRTIRWDSGVKRVDRRVTAITRRATRSNGEYNG